MINIMNKFIVIPNHVHGIIEIIVGANNYSPDNVIGLKRAKNLSPLLFEYRTPFSLAYSH